MLLLNVEQCYPLAFNADLPYQEITGLMPIWMILVRRDIAGRTAIGVEATATDDEH